MGMGLKGGLGAARSVVGMATVGLVCAAHGQVQEEWVAIHSGNLVSYGGALAMAIDSFGDLYVAGKLDNDYRAVKYDADGNLLWNWRWANGGSATELVIGSSGNVYITGTTRVFGLANDFFTVKLDATGNLIWFDNQDNLGNRDVPVGIALDGAGNVYVTGSSAVDLVSDKDWMTLKYDPDGNLVWKRLYNGPADGDDRALGLAVDAAGNAYVTGGSRVVGAGYDYLTIKYDPDGNVLWESRYDTGAGSHDEAQAIVLDDEGNVIVTGRSYISGATHFDYATVKYDVNGNELWVRRYDGPQHSVDEAFELAVDSTGAVYVSGRSIGLLTSVYDFATLKYDGAGNLLWVRRYDGPGDDGPGSSDFPTGLVVDADRNAYVTGSVIGVDNLDEFVTLKYDTNGNLLWLIPYRGLAGGGGAQPSAIALGSGGSVYVAGAARRSSGSISAFATIKYSQTAVTLPDSFSVVRGFLTGGTLSDLFASDDLRLDVRAGLTLFLGESPLQVVVTGTSAVEVPTELRFKLEASANTPGLTQTIELFNYVTSSFEQVDLAVPGFSDGIVEVVITLNPGRFVQAGTREMRAKVSYQQVGLTLLWPWSVRLDQAVWTIVP